MTCESALLAVYALESQVFQGPGIGLPARNDQSPDARLVRRVYKYALLILAAARMRNLGLGTVGVLINDEFVHLQTRIDRAGLAWPYKQDLLKILHSSDKLRSLLQRGAA